MFGGKDADWRSQLDTKYSESAEFQDILSQYTEEKHVDPTTLFPHSTAVADAAAPMNKTYPAIRFPPLSKMQLPPPLDDAQFIKELDASTMTRQSMKMDDSLAGIQFLEAMLKSMYEKVKEIRESVIENGKYLQYLTKPLQPEDITNIHSVVLENLVLMRDDSVHLLEEIQVFGIEKMHEIVTVETDSTPHLALISSLRESLISRGQALQDAAATSLLMIDHLTEFAYSLVHYPPQPYCAADGLAVSWEQRIEFQRNKAKWSRTSLQYLAYSCSRALPACNAFFAYLQHPAEYDYRLWIQDSPLGAAFPAIVHFMALQHKRILSPRESISHSLKDLVLSNCGLNDSDCSTLASHLKLFPHLVSLRLSRNKITYSGVASLATHIFEHGSQLKLLYLDHNRINKEGAALLAQILPRMKQLQELSVAHNPIRDQGCFQILKHCLNPRRKAHASFPRLNNTQSLAYSLARRSGRTTESDGLLGELDMDGADGDGSLARGLEALGLGEEGEEGEEEVLEEEEEEVRSGLQSVLSRYPPKCYFADYFLVAAAARTSRHSSGTQGLRRSLLQQVLWVNDEHEEFDMDAKSEYSDDGETRSRSNSRMVSAEEKDGLSWSQLVGSHRSQIQAKYPLIVKKILSLRLRLAAVNMFLKLKQRGHPSLSTLYLDHCSLSPSVLPAVRHALIDNHTLTSIDLSGHPLLLAATKHCQLLSEMLPLANLRRLVLNNVGLRDNGLLVMSKAIATCPTLIELQMSRNAIGPTGANIVANLAKAYACDTLSIHRGTKVKTAPLRMNGVDDDGDGDGASVLTDTLESAAQLRPRASASNADDFDETASYVDNDIFEGDESDDDDDDDTQGAGFGMQSYANRAVAVGRGDGEEEEEEQGGRRREEKGSAAKAAAASTGTTKKTSRSVSIFRTAARFTHWKSKSKKEL